LFVLGAAFACVFAAPGLIRAEDAPRELEERTSADLEKLKPLLDAKNWDAAIALLNSIHSRVGPESYDMAIITDVEAKIYLQKGDYAKAIPPWEIALRLSDAHNFFDKNSVQEMIYFLAQIYYQEAQNSKVPATQKQYFAKAASYLERWMRDTTKPAFDPSRQEAALFYGNLLYNEAVVSGDPDQVDKDLLKRAEVEINKGLLISPRPKDSFYLILLAIAQQENNYQRLADLLELLVKQYPAKKDYWPQLASVYLNLANSEKDPTLAKEYNTRAILAIERAQALGFMKTPKDNYTLVGIYFNVGQFGRATEILHAGLRDGSIDNDQKNWELLISCYQQAERPFQAIEAAQEGAKKFKTGQLDFQAAQICYALNKPEESYKFLKSAIEKGGVDKPFPLYNFMAYVCWELNKWDEAKAAVEKAMTFPEGKKDQQLPRLKQTIEESIQERAANTSKPKSL
jgi:hypothetical protein